MAATATSTTVLVGVEDITPQTQPFDSVRDLDEDEGDLVDVGVDDDGRDGDGISEDPLAAVHVHDHDDDESDDRSDLEMTPLLLESNIAARGNEHPGISPPPDPGPGGNPTPLRSRHQKSGGAGDDPDVADRHPSSRRSCLKRKKSRDGLNTLDDDPIVEPYAPKAEDGLPPGPGEAKSACGRLCRESTARVLRTTVTLMNFLARLLLWGSFAATVVGVVWYSRELRINGTDPHLIAWFSAGAFVLLGFPISMCGIVMHLKNYYQPNVQCYVVRILWMVPIYSIESWLCLRFHTLAIYIETLRDCYESYVLYSFFQFLIEVLGGEDALVLMLKDKSPTRGAHIWGMGHCMKPWVMGQPLSRRMSFTPDKKHGGVGAALLPKGPRNSAPSSQMATATPRPVKRVQWTSPFFVKCKFGVLQYVLLKFVSSIFVMILEMCGLYKEGDFTPRGGYLYICILTNLSQCWALYCLVFFYYALKNELGPIRPVGKFLSVKALVFFTWWQSLGISILFQMGMIPHYTSFDNGKEWTAEAVAKGLQDWLICIEMFCAAIVHTFVFPHTDYLEPLGIMEQRAGHQVPNGIRRLGRKGRHGYRRGDDKSACSKGSGGSEGCGLDLELGTSVDPSVATPSKDGGVCSTVEESDKESTGAGDSTGPRRPGQRQGFVRALLDSTLPRDVLDESVGIFKGEFNVEKKTLLHHAATSDEYDLFSQSSKRRKAKLRQGVAAVPRRKGKEKKEIHSPGFPDSVQLNEKRS